MDILNQCMAGCKGLIDQQQSVLHGKVVSIGKKMTVTDYLTTALREDVISENAFAVIADGNVKLSFYELEEYSNRLAKVIRTHLGFWTSNNIDGDLVIGVCMPPSHVLIVLIFAILKLGCAYLCMEPKTPEQQLIRVIGNCRPLCIFTENSPVMLSRFGFVKHLCPVWALEEFFEIALSAPPDPNLPVPLEALLKPYTRVAAIVFTAGTTGGQLGVRVGHPQILNRVLWQSKCMPFEPDEVASLFSPIVDIDHIGELFTPLLQGIPVSVVKRHIINKPTNLIEKVHEDRISRITLSPAALDNLLVTLKELSYSGRKEILPTLRFCIVNGEPLMKELAERYFHFFSDKESKPSILHKRTDAPVLVNFYGATELTSECSFDLFYDMRDMTRKLSVTETENVPIGIPIYNTSIYILNEEFEVQPMDTVGQICVSGLCVCMGYVTSFHENQGTLPSSAQNHFFYSHSKKIFKTGDLGRITEDQNGDKRLYYEGRSDMIIKINAKKVDLNDIQNAMDNTNCAIKSTVLCFRPETEEQSIFSACILKEGVTAAEMTEKLSSVLAAPLIPEIFPVPFLPYLSNGRLDKEKMLRKYQATRFESTSEDWGPLNLTITEKTAAKTLCEVIAHCVSVSVRFVIANFNTSFYNIGGESINSVSVVTGIRENGYPITIEDFVTAPKISIVLNLMLQRKSEEKGLSLPLRYMSYDFAKSLFRILPMEEMYREKVISLLSKCYLDKSELVMYVQPEENDFRQYVNGIWSWVLKQDLSVVAISWKSGQIVGAALNVDINEKMKTPRKLTNPMKYMLQLNKKCDKKARGIKFTRDKNVLEKNLLMGTSLTLSPSENVLLINLLLKESGDRGILRGFSQLTISSPNGLVKQLCTIQKFCPITECQLNQFVARDSSRPFSMAPQHHTNIVFHKSLFKSQYSI